MKVLHISSNDLVGRRFNGLYMEKYSDANFSTEMAVWNKQSKNNFVHLIPPENRVARLISKFIMMFTSRLGLDGLAGSGGWLISARGYFKSADVLHMQMIHGFSNVSILSLPMLSKLKPIVWTVHDSWIFTGGCEHPLECNRWLYGCSPLCPHPRCKSILQHFVPYLHWKIKKWVYKNSEITLVATSHWMHEKISMSPLLCHLPCYFIPFGIDTDVFKPLPKSNARKRFSILPDQKVIAFRDSGIRSDKFKGLNWLLKALKLLKRSESTTLLILENGKGFMSLSSKFNIIKTGWIDGEDIVNAFSAADLFIMPSIQESFGLMAIESMACGTPVIVFTGTALPDIVRAPIGGLAVKAKDSNALAEAIELLLNDDGKRVAMGKKARLIAESEYSLGKCIERHKRMYAEVIKKHNNTAKN